MLYVIADRERTGRWHGLGALTLLLVLMGGSSLDASDEESASQPSRPILAPLRVHPDNPRYFTDATKQVDGSLRAVYLTGSHTWANLIDRGTSDPPPVFDFEGYLDFLQKHNHNFIRLWGRQLSWYQKYGDEVLYAGPLPWQRTGPRKALDGEPKFDLSQFEPMYFERLRSRVKAAQDGGIYVSVMVFGGHAETTANWTGSPFHRDNNINGIDGDTNQDGSGSEIETLNAVADRIASIQKAYVKKVIDTLNDLDNVLFEISNEGGSTSKDWQYDLIRFIHAYERSKPKQHPVGMTAGFWPVAETKAVLRSSPADWVSYQFEMKPLKENEAFNVNDPFVADGHKVSIQDSDHWWVVEIYKNEQFGRSWVWKSFCRGHNPILMEHLPPRSFVAHDHQLSLEDPGYIASRKAMGQTRRYAERMNLAAMTPSKEIASTTYCLANAGKEYLVYLPSGGSVTVDLSAAQGELAVEWFDPVKDAAVGAGSIEGGSKRKLESPFSGDTVLYLVITNKRT
jgi:hypothetical protein